MSLLSSINIAQQALSANQSAISVISNNVANVDTAGYSKLRVNMSEVINYGALNNNTTSIADSLNGVQVESITRYSNAYLQSYYWNSNSDLSYDTQYQTSALNLEDLTNELNDGGLSDALTSFYEAADAMNDDPSDITARQAFISSAENVTSVFNSMSKSLTNLETSLVGTAGATSPSEMADQINSVNDILDQLADVNQSIVKTNLGGTSSTALLDERDALVTKLTNYIPVTTSTNSNGTINVKLGNYSLVNSGEVQGYLKATNTSDTSGHVVTTMSLVDEDGNTLKKDVTSSIDSGSLGAILDVAGTSSSNLTISGVLDNINTLANQFAQTFNDLQLNTDSNGTPLAIDSTTKTLTPATEAIFSTSDGTTTITAGNITVNSKVSDDPYLIAAARTDTTSSTYSNTQTGSSTNSTEMLNTRSTKLSGLNNLTIEDYLSSVVSNVGTQTSNIKNSYTTQSSVTSEISKQLTNDTGVNLDEELTDLVKYQRAYEAAARVFTTCNDILAELIKLGE